MKTYTILLLTLISITAFAQNDTLLFQNKEFCIYKDSAFFKGKEVYNAKKDLDALIKKAASVECPVDYKFYYNPLSLIDTYYSYESGEGGELACGNSGSGLSVQTINLNTNTTVFLSHIFTEESILKALKADGWIKEMEKERNKDFQSITTFTAFVDSINQLNYAKFKPNSFAMMRYDSKKNKVAVRFVGEANMGFNHNNHLQLGLWLEPKKAFKELIENKTHFTLRRFKNGLRK